MTVIMGHVKCEVILLFIFLLLYTINELDKIQIQIHIKNMEEINLNPPILYHVEYCSVL